MAGLIQVGRQYEHQATNAMTRTAGLEDARERTGDQIEQAEKQQKMMGIGTGAAVGAMAGMKVGAVGGPMGMAIGAGVGLLATSLF